MYQKILVPLDGSKRAERILPHVQELARRFDSEIVFLRVIESITALMGAHVDTPGLYLDAYENMRNEAREYLAGMQGEFRQMGIKARTIIERGPVVNKIIQLANAEQSDLIAMASHGRSGLSRVFYGSVAAGVLQQIDRPLLLIRADD